MALIVQGSGVVFDTTAIGKGWLVYAKHKSWDDGKAGFVTAVSEEQIIVQYHPPIGNITNHFAMKASEVSDGEWTVRWSEDLSTVDVYPEEDAEPEEEQDGT